MDLGNVLAVAVCLKLVPVNAVVISDEGRGAMEERNS